MRCKCDDNVGPSTNRNSYMAVTNLIGPLKHSWQTVPPIPLQVSLSFQTRPIYQMDKRDKAKWFLEMSHLLCQVSLFLAAPFDIFSECQLQKLCMYLCIFLNKQYLHVYPHCLAAILATLADPMATLCQSHPECSRVILSPPPALSSPLRLLFMRQS